MASMFFRKLLPAFLFAQSPTLCAQELPSGLNIIASEKKYHALIDSVKAFELVSLAPIPHLKQDMKYGDSSNFMGKPLYEESCAGFLIVPAFEALRKAAEQLAKSGFGLIVWDAYRPYSVTEAIWEEVQDERYAANPAKGSGHNRGVSIDCTLYELNSGKEVAMPTAFDDFSEKAHQDYMALPEPLKRNREILKKAMQSAGFTPLSTEWWHFTLRIRPDPPVFNLSFPVLMKISPLVK